jgi:hypothetical protein
VDTSGFVLRYDKQQYLELQGFTDADWGSEADGKSRAAYVFKLAGGAVSWQSKKLEGIATSTAEAEYKALSEGAKEAIWLRRLLTELGVGGQDAILLQCDNESAISLAHNPVMHQRTKHIKIAWHFVRVAVKSGEVCLQFVRTHLQDADILTKALNGPKFKDNRERIGLLPRAAMGHSSLCWGLIS